MTWWPVGWSPWGRCGLSVRPLPHPPPEALREAALQGLRQHGTDLLRWSPRAVALRRRLAFLHRALGAPWPDVSEEALLAQAEGRLGQVRSRADLAGIEAGEVLSGMLPWASGAAARLEELAPERVEVPSGSRIRVDYTPEQPVLAVKLQEMFGALETPRLADGRVPLLLHLLSPPPGVPRPSPPIWRPSGRRATGVCGPSCAAAIPSTPGRRTPPRPNPPAARRLAGGRGEPVGRARAGRTPRWRTFRRTPRSPVGHASPLPPGRGRPPHPDRPRCSAPGAAGGRGAQPLTTTFTCTPAPPSAVSVSV